MKQVVIFVTVFVVGVTLGLMLWCPVELTPPAPSAPLVTIQLPDPRPVQVERKEARTDERSGAVVCDLFSMRTRVNGDSLRLALDTDLPDHTVVMVSVSRIYWEKGSPERYSIQYVNERSTVGNWKAEHEISISDDKFYTLLLAKQQKMDRVGLGFEVARVSDEIEVRMVVPIFQPDPRFGKRNEHLVGPKVRTTGTRVVEDEIKFSHPLR